MYKDESNHLDSCYNILVWIIFMFIYVDVLV